MTGSRGCGDGRSNASYWTVHNGLLGGVLFGWASIDHTLLEAPIEEGGAGLNLDDTARIFSHGYSVGRLAGPCFRPSCFALCSILSDL